MSVTLPTLLGIFVISLIFSALFSMLEAAVIAQDKHRLQHLADEQDTGALIMLALLKRTDRLLSTLLLCNNLANVTCAASATAIAAYLLPSGEVALLLVTLIVTFILLVFSEITPKVIGVRSASTIALAFARTLKLLTRLLLPLTTIANFCSNLLLRIGGIKTGNSWQTAMSFKELRSAVRAAARTQDDNHQHYHMVDKTLRLNELTVEKIMTPRHLIIGINLNDDMEIIRQHIFETRHNKLLLFTDNIDHSCGVLETIVALRLAYTNRLSTAALKAAGQEVEYIPAAATALQQLQHMRQEKKQLALVVDGSGRIIGLLTFADFATAIIGADETSPVHKRHDGALLLSGNTPLLQLEQLLPGTQAPTNIDATTINGMILEYVGFLPEHLFCLQLHDWRLEISRMDDKSVQRVAVLPLPLYTEDMDTIAD
ncbi:MAG: CNNM domain-containing protein [Proteobacteria bacterium]|nr:CNNM domain-containing protein [Pseudomonadota bacterium]